MAPVQNRRRLIKIFMGGRGGGWGEGSSERCLKWWVGVRGFIKGSFQKHLKTGVGKDKFFAGGGGLKVSPPLPLRNFNRTQVHLKIPEHKVLSFSVRKEIIENDNSLVVISLSKVSENEFLQTL